MLSSLSESQKSIYGEVVFPFFRLKSLRAARQVSKTLFNCTMKFYYRKTQPCTFWILNASLRCSRHFYPVLLLQRGGLYIGRKYLHIVCQALVRAWKVLLRGFVSSPHSTMDWKSHFPDTITPLFRLFHNSLGVRRV